MSYKKILLLTLLGMALSALPGAAARIDGVTFSPDVKLESLTLNLRGMGILHYKIFFKVYAAALYVDAAAMDKDPLDDIAKRIEVHYKVEAKAKDFIDAGDRALKQAFDAKTLETVASRLTALNSWYPDPKPGDRCAVTYVPGKGTELSFNGQSLGIIPGADFARVYFSIWLGDKPADAGLRKGLLKRPKK